jgi:hypothetical protein
VGRVMKCRTLILAALLTIVGVPSAQTERHREELSIEGYSGQATVVRIQGHALVDVVDLARITDRLASRATESL